MTTLGKVPPSIGFAVFRLLILFSASSVVLAALAFGTHLYYGSFARAKAVITRKPVVLEASTVSVGTVQNDHLVEAVFNVANYSDQTGTIVGGGAECSCLVTQNLPLVVPAEETRRLSVVVNTKGKSGTFREPITFFIDWNGVYTVSAEVIGTVSNKPKAKEG